MAITATPKPLTRAIARQEQLLPFLLDPHSYPHGPKAVRLLQTNSSFVFTAPPFVFKVKKAMNFGFLDFSTLEKRRYFCEREVVLNRRLCPSVYRGVLPITRWAGKLSFGGDGEVVEYAVQMRHLSDRDFLKARLQRGEIGAADLDRVVAVLKKFYRAHPPTREIGIWGTAARLRISTDENFQQVEPFVNRTLSRAAFESIRRYTNGFLERNAGAFASRVRAGHIRDCHGDLHSEHIHITARHLHIIDCIDFNDRFRYVDVANDVAFLAMDLDHGGRPDLAGYFIRTIASALGDEGMGGMVDFYKCYRAFVRGKVESLHSIAHAAGTAEREVAAMEAQRYFKLALRYAIIGSGPAVLAVMGRIATGKSHLAAALASELDWPVYASDRVRKQMAGVPLLNRGNDRDRRALYSKGMTSKTYAALFAAAGQRVRAGAGMILDATFGRQTQRRQLLRRLKRRGVVVRFVESQVNDATLRRRLAHRGLQKGEMSDARLEDFEVLTAQYEPPNELGPKERIAVNSGGAPEKALARVLKALVRIRLEGPFRKRARA
jgi:aminoglycoside phosphotransferase family enzyme/predicted kinase